MIPVLLDEMQCLLSRPADDIIGDVVVKFELQFLDPSPFVYADPGKNPTAGISLNRGEESL